MPAASDLARVLLTPSPDSLYSDAHLALNVRPVSGFMNVGLWTDPFTPLSRPTSSSLLPYDLTTAGQALVRLVADFGNLRGKRVLDVGYGLGDSSLLLHSEFGCDVTGITFSAQQAAIAQLRAHRLGLTGYPPGTPGVHLHQGDAAQLEHEWRSKLDASPVDAIVSIDSAYHYHPRSAFFAQAFTVLSHKLACIPPRSPPLAPASSTDATPPSRHRSRTPSSSSSATSMPTLVAVDLVVPDTLAGRCMARVASIPLANLGNLLAYERDVTRAGFVHVDLVDVSGSVFPGLVRYLTGARKGVRWRIAGWMWWIMWRVVGVQCVLVRGQVPPPLE